MKRSIYLAAVILSVFCLTIRSQDAPVTSAPFISNTSPGNVNANITVADFSGIGSIALELRYNPYVLTFTGAVPNAAFDAADFTVTSTIVSSGIQKITISYPSGNDPVSLDDGSTLVTLSFSFTTANEFNHSTLAWFDNGSSCEYHDAGDNPLSDTPTGEFYINGLIATQVAPVSFLPALDFYTAGPFQVPITVNNFDNIGSIALTFEYDPAVITYSSSFTSSIAGLTVGDQPSTAGKRKIVVGWFGDSPLSLPDGSEVVSIGFNYISGTTSLLWLDNGVSCEYGDAFYYALYDSPLSEYYKHGQVIPTPAPVIKADTVAGIPGSLVSVPVTVWGFENINSMNLTLDFNNAFLTFSCATLYPGLPGELDADASTPGRVVLSWTSATEQTLPDATRLMYLAFSYAGGTSALAWFNSGSTCQFTTGTAYVPLTDLPTNQFYHNGRIEPQAGPAIWTGTTSTAWEVASNWQDAIEPESFFDVLITTSNSPPNWPVFTGDFTTGQHCRNLTLQGAAQMTVTGDMTIETGKIINMTSSGLLKVGGDWINQGIFKPGAGTVDFYGAMTGEIPSGVSPGDFLVNYGWSTFTAGMTPLSGASAGPSGDDAHTDAGIGFTFKYLDANYTQVRINTNGWLSLNLSGGDATSGDNTRLFYNLEPYTVLAPWWDDLKADGSSAVSYKTEGSAPNRVFTAEWKNILAFSSVATARLNFQVKLYETSNAIEFCYGSVVAGVHNDYEGASIGISDGGGGGGRVLEGTTGTIGAIVTCLASDSSWPGVNYRFTPPASSKEEIFWKVSVSKTGGAQLRILRNTRVTGL